MNDLEDHNVTTTSISQFSWRGMRVSIPRYKIDNLVCFHYTNAPYDFKIWVAGFEPTSKGLRLKKWTEIIHYSHSTKLSYTQIFKNILPAGFEPASSDPRSDILEQLF